MAGQNLQDIFEPGKEYIVWRFVIAAAFAAMYADTFFGKVGSFLVMLL